MRRLFICSCSSAASSTRSISSGSVVLCFRKEKSSDYSPPFLFSVKVTGFSSLSGVSASHLLSGFREQSSELSTALWRLFGDPSLWGQGDAQETLVCLSSGRHLREPGEIKGFSTVTMDLPFASISGLSNELHLGAASRGNFISSIIMLQPSVRPTFFTVPDFHCCPIIITENNHLSRAHSPGISNRDRPEGQHRLVPPGVLHVVVVVLWL